MTLNGVYVYHFFLFFSLYHDQDGASGQMQMVLLRHNQGHMLSIGVGQHKSVLQETCASAMR